MPNPFCRIFIKFLCLHFGSFSGSLKFGEAFSGIVPILKFYLVSGALIGVRFARKYLKKNPNSITITGYPPIKSYLILIIIKMINIKKIIKLIRINMIKIIMTINIIINLRIIKINNNKKIIILICRRNNSKNKYKKININNFKLNPLMEITVPFYFL